MNNCLRYLIIIIYIHIQWHLLLVITMEQPQHARPSEEEFHSLTASNRDFTLHNSL